MRPVIRNAAIGVAALVVIVVLIAQPWRPSERTFRAEDIRGYAACEAFEQAQGSGGDNYRSTISRAASEGLHSKDDRIVAAIDDGTGYRQGEPAISNLGDFRDACKGAGYRFD